MSEPFLGEIKFFGFNFAPEGFAFCNGQLLPINQNQSLYSLLGTNYGGDGRSTFGLPDLQGRVPLHFGQGSGLSERRIGARGGSESHTQAPAHTHQLRAVSANADQTSPSGTAPATAREDTYSGASPTDTNMSTDAIQSTGPSSVDHMPPFLAVNCCIALTGLFPSRP
jgi:microcystin-dependent protein